MPKGFDYISAPSPNFDERKLDIALLVLHYTGMESGPAALERMRDPEAKVSAHYMVEEDGRVYQLVDEDKRAWHAGVSEWNGERDINSNSIGIEIVNGGHDHGLPEFPDVQINAVIALSKAIMSRYNLPPKAVVAHSDIAPGRKIDPGEKFPWAGLAAAGIGLWPQDIPQDQRLVFSRGDRDRGIAIIQTGLARIGYGVHVTGVLDETTQMVLEAFQRRYRPERIDGAIDMQIMALIKTLTEQVAD